MAWELVTSGVNFGFHDGGIFMGKPNFLKLPNGYIAMGAEYEYTLPTTRPAYIGPIICFYNIATGHLISPTYVINSPDSCRFESMDYLYDGDDLIVVGTYKVTNLNHKLVFFWYNFGTGASGQRELSLGSALFLDYTANVLGIFGRYLFYTYPTSQTPSSTSGYTWFCYRAYSIDILSAISTSSTITPVLRYITYNIEKPGSDIGVGFPQRAARLPPGGPGGGGLCYMPFGGSTPRPASSTPTRFNNFPAILNTDGTIEVFTHPGYEARITPGYDLSPYGSNLFIPTPRVTMVDPSNYSKTITIFSSHLGGDTRNVIAVYTSYLWNINGFNRLFFLRNSEETLHHGHVPHSSATLPFMGGVHGPYGTSHSWAGSFQQTIEDSWVDGKVRLFPVPLPLTPDEEDIIAAETDPEFRYVDFFRAIYNSGGPYSSLEIDFTGLSGEINEVGFLNAYYEWYSKLHLGQPPSLDTGEEGRLLRYGLVGEGMYASPWAIARWGKKIQIGGVYLPYDFYDVEVDGPPEDSGVYQSAEVYGDVFKYGEDYYMLRTQRYSPPYLTSGGGTEIWRFTESNRESIGYII